MVFHFPVTTVFLDSIFKTCANLREKNTIISYTSLFLNNFLILKIFRQEMFYTSYMKYSFLYQGGGTYSTETIK